MNKLLILLSVALLGGCAANAVMNEAVGVDVTNEAPDRQKCQFIGEVVGSQGNWFTGDWTSNKNLLVGARNELRNEAYKLGANMVWVQDVKNAQAWGAYGTTNTTAIGRAYRCQK